MSDLYKTIMELCDIKGITGYRLCKDAGMQPSVLTDLKMGRQLGLSAKNADKIASYFGVSVGYLLGTEQKESAPAEAGADDEMAQILQEFRENPELKTLFSLSKNATPEELKQYISVIKALRGGN